MKHEFDIIRIKGSYYCPALDLKSTFRARLHRLIFKKVLLMTNNPINVNKKGDCCQYVTIIEDETHKIIERHEIIVKEKKDE